MVAWNMGRPWADRSRAYARTARKPIVGTLLEERAKAYLISTATRDKVWLPKRLVSHDAGAGVFTMPQWLALEKLLD